MKTKNNSMKIMKTESTANEQERKEAKYKPVTPVILDNVSEDVTFIRSADVCKLLNVSNSLLQAGRNVPLQQRRNHELSGIQL